MNGVSAPKDITSGLEVFINPSGTCDLNDSLFVRQGARLSIYAGKTLNINVGSLFFSGIIEGPGKIRMTGGVSNLTDSTTIQPMTAPLELSSKKLILTQNFRSNAIALTNNSYVELYNNDLAMDTFSLSSDAQNFIVSNGTGQLVRSSNTGINILYPLGTNNSSYTPVTLKSPGPGFNYGAKVRSGVNSTGRLAGDVPSGNVGRTWVISGPSGRNVSATFQWNLSDEQPNFLRENSYVAQSHGCPAPPNCTDGYYDVQARSSAAGTGPFTQTRDNITDPTTFIVKSSADTSTFTGNGDWNDPNNWTIGIVPPNVIPNGRVIIINHPTGGQCLFNGDITIQKGSLLKILPGKQLRVTGKINVEQ